MKASAKKKALPGASLDALCVLREGAVGVGKPPGPAIRPYPLQYVTPAALKDGTPITIRPIRPEDEPLMVKFHRLLSPGSVYSRYFEFLQLEQRIAHERLARLCFIDYDLEMVLVAEHRSRATGERQIIGVGRLMKLPGASSAEFAVVVGDPWQRRGLGTLLLNRLVKVGRDERLGSISGEILSENVAMRRVASKAGFQLRHPPGENTFLAEIALQDSRAAAPAP